ncbi:imidazoleglycerol-phosphate dehydratase, partial [Butyricicoccus sp. 1XD8-22]
MSELKRRVAKIERMTNETKISVELDLDGDGKAEVNTGVPFMDHMLDLFIKHGLFDGKILAHGDTHIDDHHTTEDIGIV